MQLKHDIYPENWLKLSKCQRVLNTKTVAASRGAHLYNATTVVRDLQIISPFYGETILFANAAKKNVSTLNGKNILHLPGR